MKRHLSTFMWLVTAAVALPVLAVTLIFCIEIAGDFITQLSWIEGPAGVGPDSILTGQAFMIFASVGMLSIPAAVLLKLLIGGRLGRQSNDRPRPGKGGF